jgi:hypothetical protein
MRGHIFEGQVEIRDSLRTIFFAGFELNSWWTVHDREMYYSTEAGSM